MNVYGTEQIRNVVLLGHGGAGKTTVAEALALLTGVTKRMGKVPDGNTISDYDKEEIKRQFSISTTLIPLEYEGEDGPIKINLLDTPGFFDFVGEVEEAISLPMQPLSLSTVRQVLSLEQRGHGRCARSTTCPG